MKPTNKIKDTLDKLELKMSDELKAYPITKREAKPRYRLYLSLSLVLTTILVVATILSINFLAPANIKLSYYMIDINPSFIIKVEDGAISEAKSLNNDADALLIDLKLDGKSLDKGIDLIADEAIREGYILKSGDAIRVSGIDSSAEALDMVEDSFKEAFKKRGFYVGIAKKSLNSDNKDEFNNKFNSMNSLSYLNKDLENESLEDVYKNEYLGQYLYEAVILNINSLKENQALINKIDKKYDEIYKETHKDYFIIKKYNINVSDNVKGLIDEMDSLVEAYYSLTGIKLDSKLELELEVINNNIIDYDLLLDITKSVDSFIKWIKAEASRAIEAIKSLLANLMPQIEESLNYLLELPTSLEEYKGKLEVLTRSRHDMLISMNIDSYNDKLPKISDSEYDSFIARIMDEYESIENYFNKLQNKTIKQLA